MSEGICPFAVWCPGPEWKTGYSGRDKIHIKVGVALHSAEYESTPEWDDYTTLHNALFSDREASWTFSICDFLWYGQEAAILFQHYPIGTVCWAQGYQGNLWLDSIEHERIAPHKLTGPQYELLVKTLRWVWRERGWLYHLGIGNKQTPLGVWEGKSYLAGWLFDHNAVPGAPATDCQVFTRGQIDPQQLLRDLKEEGMDWPKAKLELFNQFLDWFDLFPESEAEKKDAIRQERENNAYREFYDKQIAWRSPPR